MSVEIDMSGNMDTQKDAKAPFSFASMTKSGLNLREFFQQTYKNIRPWSEFAQTQNFKLVANLQRLTNRLMRNLAYFQSNYLFVFLVLFIYCLITSPLILFVLCGVFYGCHKIKKSEFPVTIFNRQLNSNQQCIAILLASIPVLYLAGAGAIIFWVIGASFTLISIHASFYNIDALVTEDMEGFLSETV